MHRNTYRHIIVVFFISFYFISDQANAICMENNFAILRSGPSKKYPQQGVARKYRPLQILKQGKTWSKVTDSKRRIFWIKSKNLTDDFECAIVTSQSANTRTGPGTNFRKFSAQPNVVHNFSAKILKTQKDWVQLESSKGNQFWIFKDLLWIK